MDVRSGLFGGRGEVRVWDLGGVTPPFTACLYCELEAGGAVGVHQQASDAEMLIVVEGEATVSVAGVARRAGRGASLAVPLGATLAIDNGASVLRYLIVKARSP